MPTKTKSLPTKKAPKVVKWVWDQNHFKDWELDFDYCIFHQKKHIDYFTGGLSALLSEYTTFRDIESLCCFLAFLTQGSVLIPVKSCPNKDDESIWRKILTVKTENIEYDGNYTPEELKMRELTNKACHIKEFNFIPLFMQHEDAGKDRFFFPIITSIRGIKQTYSEEDRLDTYLYIPFEDVLKWLKKHKELITDVIFDPYKDPVMSFNIDAFLKFISMLQKAFKKEGVHKVLDDIRGAALQKHMPKKKTKTESTPPKKQTKTKYGSYCKVLIKAKTN